MYVKCMNVCRNVCMRVCILTLLPWIFETQSISVKTHVCVFVRVHVL